MTKLNGDSPTSKVIEEKIKAREAEAEQKVESVKATKKMLMGWASSTVDISFPHDGKNMVLTIKKHLSPEEKAPFKPMLKYIGNQKKLDALDEQHRADVKALIAEFCDFLVVSPKMGVDFWKTAPDELGSLVLSVYIDSISSMFEGLAELKLFRGKSRGTADSGNGTGNGSSAE